MVDLSGLDADRARRVVTVVRRAIDRNCTVGRTLEHSTTIELTISDLIERRRCHRDSELGGHDDHDRLPRGQAGHPRTRPRPAELDRRLPARPACT